MAKQINIDPEYDALVLSKEETVQIVTLLIGQLADVPVPNNFAGLCPSVFVTKGEKRFKLSFIIETNK